LFGETFDVAAGAEGDDFKTGREVTDDVEGVASDGAG
jgi:hypothetical protein